MGDIAGPDGLPRGSRLLRFAIAGLVSVCITACAGAGSAGTSADTSADGSADGSATPSVPQEITSALPAGPCGDDQPGRYSTEMFQAAPVTTVAYTDGLLADIYAPAADPAACRTGVVWLHGGGFTRFDRTGSAEQAWGNALAARGYVVASIDYRLGGMDPFVLDQISTPQQAAVVANAIADGQTAVRWLRAAGSTLGVDPARVAIGGTSAGAMTALGAALTASAEGRACTVVSVSGDIEDSWVGAGPPSALLIHGNADQVVPYDASVDAVDRLTSAGGQAELVTIDGAGHEIAGVPLPEMVTAASGWLREHAAGHCG